ncbi:MAG: hypothetical protein ACRELA_08640 [Candidatus Rokuibacteriota bacterium]
MRDFRLIAIPMLVVLALLAMVTPSQAQTADGAPPHIQTARTFLTAWAHQRWDDLKTVAADKVTVRLGDKSFTLEPAAQKSDVMIVVPFRGLSTVRVDGKVKGITVEEMGLKVGDNETRGPGTITLSEENGAYRVIGVSVPR